MDWEGNPNSDRSRSLIHRIIKLKSYSAVNLNILSRTHPMIVSSSSVAPSPVCLLSVVMVLHKWLQKQKPPDAIPPLLCISALGAGYSRDIHISPADSHV